MNDLNCRNDIWCEIKILENRLKLISEYEKYIIDERTKIEDTIRFQKEILNQIEDSLGELSGIENKLFAEIVIKGTNVTKAIEKVAEEESKDVSTLWKNYYPKVKNKISQIQSTIPETIK